MKTVQTFTVLILAGLAAIVLHALVAGEMTGFARTLLAEPWGRVTLADLTAGFVFIAMWMALREGAASRAAPWIVALFLFGNLVTGIYVLNALRHSGGEVRGLLLGRAA